MKSRIIQVKDFAGGTRIGSGGETGLPTAKRSAVVPIGTVDGFNYLPPWT